MLLLLLLVRYLAELPDADLAGILAGGRLLKVGVVHGVRVVVLVGVGALLDQLLPLATSSDLVLRADHVTGERPRLASAHHLRLVLLRGAVVAHLELRLHVLHSAALLLVVLVPVGCSGLLRVRLVFRGCD